MSAGIFSTNLLIAAKLPGHPEEKLKVEILKLPQKQQEVLRLNMVEGYSLTAVAKLWHVSPQYVYNIKKRALQNLKTVLV